MPFRIIILTVSLKMNTGSQTKEKILTEAIKLFYQKGFENTTIEDIQKGAGIARGSIYYHFTSKVDILEAIVDRMAEQIIKVLNPLVYGEKSFTEKLHAFFETSINIKMEKFKREILFYLDFLKNRKNYFFHYKIVEKYRNIISQMLGKILEEGIQEGVIRIANPDIYAKLLTEILIFFSEELTDVILKAQHKDDALREIENIVRVYNESLSRILDISQEQLRIGMILEKANEILELYLENKGVK